MKKFKNLFIGLCLMLMMCMPCYGQFVEPKEGDVYLWTPAYMEVFGIPLPVVPLAFLYGEFPSFGHADYGCDDDGTLMTSIQDRGVCSSTIHKRKGQFESGVQLRNTKLSQDTIDRATQRSYELSGDYDAGGYDGQMLDFLIRIPYTPRGYFFTAALQDPELFYCSEYVVECFLAAGEMEEVRIHPAPNDIYFIEVSTDWEVVGTWEQ